MWRVLVIEDEPSVRVGLRLALRRSGFEVLEAASAGAAWDQLDQADILLLDWMLPDEPGIRLLSRLRANPRYETLPVLMLTARTSEYDRVEGLLSGADDYLTKPFSTPELVARLRVLLRRSGQRDVLRMEALELDLSRIRAQLAGAPLALTRREFDLLAYLMRHPGRVSTREELLERVWGEDFFGTPRTVDQHVAQLRGKLGGRTYIETVRGKGYRFREADRG